MKRNRIDNNTDDDDDKYQPPYKKLKLNNDKKITPEKSRPTQDKKVLFSDMPAINGAIQNLMRLLCKLLPYRTRETNHNISNRQEAISFLYGSLPQVEKPLIEREDLSKKLKEKFQKIAINHRNKINTIGRGYNIKYCELFNEMSLDYSNIYKDIKDEEDAIKSKEKQEKYPKDILRSISILGSMQEKHDIKSEKYKELGAYRMLLCRTLVRSYMYDGKYTDAIKIILYVNENYKFPPTQGKKVSGDATLQYLLGYCHIRANDLEKAESALRLGLLCPESEFVFDNLLDYPGCFSKFFNSIEKTEEATESIFTLSLENCQLTGKPIKYHIHRSLLKVIELQSKPATLQSLKKGIDEMLNAERLLSYDDYTLRADANFALLYRFYLLFKYHSKGIHNPDSRQMWIETFLEIKQRFTIFTCSGYDENLPGGSEEAMDEIEDEICSSSTMQKCVTFISKLFFETTKHNNNIPKAFNNTINFYKKILELTTDKAIEENIFRQLELVVNNILKLTKNTAIRSNITIQLVGFLRGYMKCYPNSIEKIKKLVLLSFRSLESSLSSADPLIAISTQGHIRLCMADLCCKGGHYAEAEDMLKKIKTPSDWQFKKVRKQITENKPSRINHRQFQILPPPPLSDNREQEKPSISAKSQHFKI